MTIQWWAAGGGFMKMGPYTTQVKAWRALELTEEEQKRQGAIHPRDAKVWPEDTNVTSRPEEQGREDTDRPKTD